MDFGQATWKDKFDPVCLCKCEKNETVEFFSILKHFFPLTRLAHRRAATLPRHPVQPTPIPTLEGDLEDTGEEVKRPRRKR